MSLGLLVPLWLKVEMVEKLEKRRGHLAGLPSLSHVKAELWGRMGSFEARH